MSILSIYVMLAFLCIGYYYKEVVEKIQYIISQYIKRRYNDNIRKGSDGGVSDIEVGIKFGGRPIRRLLTTPTPTPSEPID